MFIAVQEEEEELHLSKAVLLKRKNPL